MQNKDIQTMLSDSLPGAKVMVQSPDGVHFEAVIISDVFQNKRAVERQKIIYAILGPYISNGAIHALSLKTFTMQEWQEKCGD